MAIRELKEQYPTRSILQLGLEEGNVGAETLLGSRLARSAGENVPQQRFIQALMNMLLQARAAKGEVIGEQAERILEPAEAGMPPTYQRAIRGAEAEALEPTIRGYEAGITGIRDIMSISRDFLEMSEEREKEERDRAWDIITSPGAKNLPDEMKKRLENIVGYKEIIDKMPTIAEPPEAKVLGKGLFERDPTTGQWKMVAQAPAEPGIGKLGTAAQNAVMYVNAARAQLGLIEEKMENIDFPETLTERITKGQWLKAQAFAQRDPNLVRFQRAKEAILNLIARARGEVGVITKTDVAQVRRTLPKLDDTLDVAWGSIQDAYNQFDEYEARIYSSAGVSPPEGGITGGMTLQLQNPQTGEIKEFSELSPEDLADALNQGFILQ